MMFEEDLEAGIVAFLDNLNGKLRQIVHTALPPGTADTPLHEK